MNIHEELQRRPPKAQRFKQNAEFTLRRGKVHDSKVPLAGLSGPPERPGWVSTVPPPWEKCSALSERAVYNLWLVVSSVQKSMIYSFQLGLLFFLVPF